MSDRWLSQEEVARAIHSINGALDIIEVHAISTGDTSDLADIFKRIGVMLENNHAA